METHEEVVGHGIDLVEIDRIAAVLERHGHQFIERCFTDRERAWAEAGRRRRIERYAARFACKEAVMKALGTGWSQGIRWTDVGVVNEPTGRPVLELSGRCRKIAADRGYSRWHVSLTHARGGRGPDGARRHGGYAMASVIAWGSPPTVPVAPSG